MKATTLLSAALVGTVAREPLAEVTSKRYLDIIVTDNDTAESEPLGRVAVGLFGAVGVAPQTTEVFKNICDYGRYENLDFFRVVPGFMGQVAEHMNGD